MGNIWYMNRAEIEALKARVEMELPKGYFCGEINSTDIIVTNPTTGEKSVQEHCSFSIHSPEIDPRFSMTRLHKVVHYIKVPQDWEVLQAFIMAYIKG